MSVVAREILLNSRPAGTPTLDTFRKAERRLPAPGEGQLLVRTLWMSVDPYMRGRMRDQPSYIAPFQVGEPLEGSAVGVVEESRAEGFAKGDVVSHFAGWRDHAVIDAAGVTKVDLDAAPAEAWLGPLGVPGFTAYIGLERIGGLKAGETVFVSAAAGAVGSMAVQIAKAKGARVIASVGSAEKAAWLRELGADAVVNYKTATDLTAALREAAPEGIDVYFDNVGGNHLDAALAVAKNSARVVISGMIAGYNEEQPAEVMHNLASIIVKRLSLRGFIVLDHYDLYPQFSAAMIGWLKDGKVTSRDTVHEGLDNAPKAFLGLFSGDNTGKMLVRLADR
ncbi:MULTISPECIES: NADP-dependent oxidoreductase [Phyllobacteriaceae]|jgi:NADPH-dependent curcumin reductase CurA|uniref:NADP-dependent oxidoreductase n=1 Tax=Mesorhizobium hungaricum TaxID=1566387 RepID=A0A1C2DYZ8_9HYPH|nr:MULTISPECIES: NADP-dependent oxidoreductase [Mesorhizobium]MBN9234552.1 NADP-dependent oxidoreductase [Mesorhizobium sp.]MDQ0328970.1 NADPH-dependent curcumin reductase CurA [Mesorhizobium sp. YL-MeA3-2017]OCX19999.1 NADP-dependent oxidoreductase [Mesorhizobium hungaricum]